jgi:hypothetical protein
VTALTLFDVFAWGFGTGAVAVGVLVSALRQYRRRRPSFARPDLVDGDL